MSDSAALVILVCFVVALLSAGGAWAVAAWHSRRVLTTRMRKVVAITTKSGDTFKGVLTEHDDQAFVLRDARMMTADGGMTVDGELIVLREDVDYLQRP